MHTFLWPESVRLSAERRFIDCFQKHPDNLLHQLVVRGHDAQRTQLSIFLGNVLAFGRFWLIGLVFDFLDDSIDSRQAHVVQRFSVNSCCHAALRFGKVCIGDHVELRIVQIAIESFILVTCYSCFFFKAFQYMNRISHGVSHTILSELKMIYCSPSPCRWLSHPRTTTGTLLP